MNDLPLPRSVLSALGIPDDVTACAIGSGHIHRSWRVDRPEGPMLLQQLNGAVFTTPEQVVENAAVITAHLLGKRSAGEYPLDVARSIPGPDGRELVHDDRGAVWRAMEFIDGTRTVDVVETSEQAGVAAGAFGAFDAAMADFAPGRLHVVIPRFHDLRWRMQQLFDAAARDPAGRARTAAEWLRLCSAEQAFVDEVAERTSRLPVRVCHNDTKINNMLFDESIAGDTLRARAVIDLDTCMPGYWMHDYGDMVRTFCSPESEDSTRLIEVRAREDVLEALTVGFLSFTGDRMTPLERSSLWIGARAMCWVVAVRFLTDWLDGDRYFAIDRPDHNLDRARNQFALYRDLTDRAALLERCLQI